MRELSTTNDTLQAYICGRPIEPKEYIEVEPTVYISMSDAAALARVRLGTFAAYRKKIPAKYAEKGLKLLPEGFKFTGPSKHVEVFFLKHKIDAWMQTYKRIKG